MQAIRPVCSVIARFRPVMLFILTVVGTGLLFPSLSIANGSPNSFSSSNNQVQFRDYTDNANAEAISPPETSNNNQPISLIIKQEERLASLTLITLLVATLLGFFVTHLSRPLKSSDGVRIIFSALSVVALTSYMISPFLNEGKTAFLKLQGNQASTAILAWIIFAMIAQFADSRKIESGHSQQSEVLAGYKIAHSLTFWLLPIIFVIASFLELDQLKIALLPALGLATWIYFRRPHKSPSFNDLLKARWVGFQFGAIAYFIILAVLEKKEVGGHLIFLPAGGLLIDMWRFIIGENLESKQRYLKAQSFKKITKNLYSLQYLTKSAIHDIANPLSLISMTCEIEQSNSLKERNSTIVKIERASRLISDILDYMRIAYQTHNLKPALKEVDIKQTIDDCLMLMEQSIRKKNLKVNLKIEKNLSAYAHESLLKSQIITNLMSNAIKFSPYDSSIEVEAYSRKDWCILNIHNGGKPITGEVIKAVQDKEILNSTQGTAGEKGHGYGLAIANQATNLIGGKLLITRRSKSCLDSKNIDEADLQGTSISIQIPLFPTAVKKR